MGRKEDEAEAERERHEVEEKRRKAEAGKGPPDHSSAGGRPPEHAAGGGKPGAPGQQPHPDQSLPEPQPTPTPHPTHAPGAAGPTEGKAGKGKAGKGGADDDPKTMPLEAYNKLATEGKLEEYAAQHGFTYTGATFEGDTVTLK